MQQINRLLLPFLFAIILLSAVLIQTAGAVIAVRPISPVGDRVNGRQWLFVIGINTYIEWPRLKTAVNDARAVKKVLLSRYCFDKKNLIELYDEQATRKNIMKKLVYLANNVRTDDSLVMFYAGHGHLDPITKEGSWIPVESGIKDVSAWISNHDIKKYLSVDAIKSRHILLVSDSCFSGDFFRGARGKLPAVTDEVIKRAYKLTSRQAITSGGLEPVSDDGFGNNSVFSHFFVKTLKENQKPFFIPSDLFPDVKAGVVENAEQFPRYGTLKDTGGQQGGELIFFLKQDMRLENLSAEAKERQQELERLKQMETADRAAKKKETAQIAKQKKKLAALDSQIEAMKKRLGGPTVKADDSLDTMLAMVEQKETQAKNLKKLRWEKKARERKRKKEIAQLKKERVKKIIAGLKPEVEKYKKIVGSKYGQSMKSAAWKSLIAKCPAGWADDVEEGDCDDLLLKINNSGVKIKTRFTNSLGMEFVCIKPGTFMMGSPSGESGRDSDEKQHKVNLTRGFYIQTTEVTQGQWESVMGNNPSEFKKGDNYPVENVSWSDAQRFIRKLNQKEGIDKYRLPTEAEWEYACRAGTTTPFSFGRCLSIDQANYNGKYPLGGCSKGKYRKKIVSVASFSPNAWGLYDMHGNVWEWCQDWYDDYPSGSVTDPNGPSSGSSRVYRGGSWINNARNCRSANRCFNSQGYRYGNLGFRLSRTGF